MSGCRLPIVNPLQADTVGALKKFRARDMPVFDDNHNSSVELLLRVIDVGRARALRSNRVLNRHLGSICLEHWMTVRDFSCGHEILQNKKVWHFGGRNQTHQIEIKIRIAVAGT